MHEMFASQVLQGLENLEAIQVQMMSAVMEGKIWPKEEMLRLFTPSYHLKGTAWNQSDFNF